MQLEIDLSNRPDNAPSTTTQRLQQHNSKICYLDATEAITAKSRLFGEGALEIAQRGRQDHLFPLPSHSPPALAHLVSPPEQYPHQSTLQHASLTSMKKSVSSHIR